MVASQEGFEPKPIIPQREKREYPKVELGDIKDYRYFSAEQVSSVLSGFGYGENMMRVHALYLHEDNSQAVGVWRATQEDGHFKDNPVLRGVEQAEAVAQTLLAALVLASKVPQDKTVRLTSIDLDFRSTAIPPLDLNTIVLLGHSEKEHEVISYGEVRSGPNILSQGYVSGAVIDTKLGERLLERTRRQQANAVTLFPFQG